MALSERLSILEAYSLSDNLIIRGLPKKSSAEITSPSSNQLGGAILQESHQSVKEAVKNLCHDSLGIDLQPGDISIAHCMRTGRKDKCRPVIVRFMSRRTRNLIYTSKKNLKVSDRSSENTFISKHLTKEASDLFFKYVLNWRLRKLPSWTQNGQVLVRFTSDPNYRIAVIKFKNDLNTRWLMLCVLLSNILFFCSFFSSVYICNAVSIYLENKAVVRIPLMLFNIGYRAQYWSP